MSQFEFRPLWRRERTLPARANSPNPAPLADLRRVAHDRIRHRVLVVARQGVSTVRARMGCAAIRCPYSVPFSGCPFERIYAVAARICCFHRWTSTGMTTLQRWSSLRCKWRFRFGIHVDMRAIKRDTQKRRIGRLLWRQEQTLAARSNSPKKIRIWLISWRENLAPMQK